MRKQVLTTLALAVVIMAVAYSSASAQSASGKAKSRTPQARVPASVLTSQRVSAPTPAASPNGTSEANPAVSAQTERVAREIQSMEQTLEQANRLLQQRLGQADRIRRQGLEKQDQKLLRQAEQMDRQAIAAYEKQLRHFETFSKQIAQTTQVRAEQAASRANGTPSRSDARGASNANRRQPSEPAPARGFFFRFGR